MHIRENRYYPCQKPWLLPSAKANFEGWNKLYKIALQKSYDGNLTIF